MSRLVQSGPAIATGTCSRFDWAALTLELAGISVTLRETTLGEFNPNPPKPPDTTLANTRAAKLGVRLEHWERAFREYVTLGGLTA